MILTKYGGRPLNLFANIFVIIQQYLSTTFKAYCVGVDLTQHTKRESVGKPLNKHTCFMIAMIVDWKDRFL